MQNVCGDAGRYSSPHTVIVRPEFAQIPFLYRAHSTSATAPFGPADAISTISWGMHDQHWSLPHGWG